jgi:two-component system, OmpR family, phosphate regulon sensor histidine kinase PhoR
VVQSRLRREVDHRHFASSSIAMNRFESSAKPNSEREGDLRHRSEFQTVFLDVAGHDLRLPVRVIQSTDEWLSSMLDADADKVRQQLGEPAVARLSEQLDRLAGALCLYEHTTTMELSPVPLAPLFDNVRTDGTDSVRQKGRDSCIRPTRAAIMCNTVLLDGIVGNLVRNAIKYADGCFRKLWRRPSGWR